MTDAEKFLQRWSRRKVEAERQTHEEVVEPVPDTAAKSDHRSQALPAADAASATPPAENRAKPAADAKAGFDLASLPPIESITAATDLRAFMNPGVPAELTRAALRRAWTADPAIRDFVGLAENAWDFTDPNAMAGFGKLPADFDVQKLVSQIFGDAKAQASEPEADVSGPPNAAQASGESTEIPSPSPARIDEQEVASLEPVRETSNPVVQRDNNDASHNSYSVSEAAETRRSHGRGLPQ
jgi:hypothetical protein